ncbi:MAG: hypothetical protein JF615_11540, partial [Asticcacaulis sp.]|nr:hypothetical protein [Asticcacaulis sp.]
MSAIYSSLAGTDMDFLSFPLMATTAYNGDPEGSATQFVLADDNAAITFQGSFGGYSHGYPTTGTITYLTLASSNRVLTIGDLNVPVATFRTLASNHDANGLRDLLLGGADSLRGDDGARDTLYGFGGPDTIMGRGGADKLGGGDGADNISGGAGDDTLTGDAGDDLLGGGAGNDLIDGGAGANWALFDDASSGVRVSLAVTGPQDTGAGLDTLVNIQHLYGSNFSDTLTGDDGVNAFIGLGGSDSIAGLGGSDLIAIGDGANSVDGGTGVDTLYFQKVTGGVNFSLAHQGAAQDTGHGLMLATSFEGAIGSTFNDTLVGDEGVNIIRGNTGGDSIDGAGGDDLLDGEAGADTVHGGDGVDSVHGGQNDDMIYGEAGNDELYGDLGNDTVTGGIGADSFHISANGGHDIVTDFKASEGDRVNLDHAAVYTVGQAGSDTVVTLAGGET